MKNLLQHVITRRNIRRLSQEQIERRLEQLIIELENIHPQFQTEEQMCNSRHRLNQIYTELRIIQERVGTNSRQIRAAGNVLRTLDRECKIRGY